MTKNNVIAQSDMITQVSAPGSDECGDYTSVIDLPEVIFLNMRGKVFEINKERLLTLPESILFGLSSSMTASPFGELSDAPDSDVMAVDFSPDCFQYILEVLSSAEKGVTPIPINQLKAGTFPTRNTEEDSLNSTGNRDVSNDLQEDAGGDSDSHQSLPWLQSSPNDIPEVLKSLPTLIVLREDLEYYVLSDNSLPEEQQLDLKNRVGDMIAEGSSDMFIFNGLKNCHTLNTPEYHLMQMLVLAGLDPEQRWSYRQRTPNTSRILSLQMSNVQLPSSPELLENIYALQKLLLFWRKPAKKCWWDKFDLTLDGVDLSATNNGGSFVKGANSTNVKVHARKVWTLELSIIGLE